MAETSNPGCVETREPGYSRAPFLRRGLALLRPQQWIKNVFVLAPLLFGGRLIRPPAVLDALIACFSFCLVSSAVYIVNDWFDRDIDRHHPEKRSRPIPAGQVSGRAALSLAACLLAAGLLLASLTTPVVVMMEAGYFGLNVLYSLVLKRIVILDVLSVAAGFVMRVLAGASAVSVEPSHWLILCTFLLALFLGFSKRGQELSLLDADSVHHRRVLAWYSPELIAQLNVIVCAAAIVCYALYTVAPDTLARSGSDRLVYSVVFVVYGLFRYLVLVHKRREGGNPAALLLRDRPLLVCVVLWAAYCCSIIYLAGRTTPL